MKLFNRRTSNQPTPTNTVNDYYQAEQSEHKVIAWLLAFVTFIVTLIVILLLFFAGRWAYQKITKKDNPTTPATTQPAPDTTLPSSIDGDSSSGSGSGQTNGAQSNTDNSTPQTSSTSTSTPSVSTQPNTGPSEPEELVRTGPDLDL